MVSAGDRCRLSLVAATPKPIRRTGIFANFSGRRSRILNERLADGGAAQQCLIVIVAHIAIHIGARHGIVIMTTVPIILIDMTAMRILRMHMVIIVVVVVRRVVLTGRHHIIVIILYQIDFRLTAA